MSPTSTKTSGLLRSASAALVLWAAPAAAELPEPFVSDRMTGLEFGIFCPIGEGEERDAPGTIEGTITSLDGVRLVAQQQVIPAALGVRFGIRAQSASGDIEPVQFAVLHPPMGTGAVTTQGWMVRYHDLGPSGQFWAFEQDFELVTGTWTMTTTAPDGDVLVSVTFEVVEPESYAGAIPSCIEGLLS